MTSLTLWPKRISARIVIAFCGLFLASSLFIGWVEFNGLSPDLAEGWKQHLQQEELQRIGAAADSKKRHLEDWIRERRADLRVVATSPLLSDLVATRSERSRRALVPIAEAWLVQFSEAHSSYDGVFVIDGAAKRVLVSSNSDTVVPDAAVLARLTESGAEEAIDLNRDIHGAAKLLIARRIGTDSKRAGWIVVVIDFDSEIRDHIDGGLGDFFGRTGEVSLYDEDGIALHALRYDGDRQPGSKSTDRDRVVQLALQGGEGVARDIDYRGVAVLAAYRHVRISPEIGWGMVVKKDEAEVLEAVEQHLSTFWALSLLALLLVFAASLVVADWITRPLRQVIAAARQVQSGDLSARAVVIGENELADLAVTFNSMAEKIEKWHTVLDTQVRLQTDIIVSQQGRLLAYSESTNDAIIGIDHQGRIDYWNPAATRMFGYTPDEALGCQIHALLTPPELIEGADRAQQRYARTGAGEMLGKVRELPAITKGGKQITVELTVSPLRVNDQWHAIGTLRDITRRKKEETLLRTIAEQLSIKVGNEYFHAMASGLAGFVNADYVLVGELLTGDPVRVGVIGSISPRGELSIPRYPLAGTPSERIVGEGRFFCRSGLQQMFPDSPLGFDEPIDACAGISLADGSGKVIGLIQVLWRDAASVSDDAEVCIQIFAARAAVELERTQAQRALDGYAHRLEDMVMARTSELTNAIIALRRAQGELVESEKLASLGRLVAGVAHELNTPIGNSVTVATTLIERMRAFDALLASGSLKRSSLTSFVDDMRQGAQLLTTSLRQAAELIQDFKQVAVDQTSSQRRPFVLKTVVEEIVTTLQPRLKKTQHSVSIHIDASIELDSYPGPFGQVMMNLLQNALDHAFEERESGHLSVDAEEDADRSVTIVVADDGIGMEAEVRNRVFDPFFTTKLGRGGSGLGLNIVYNIVSGVLGGRIVVESSPGNGSRFIITIPLVAPQPENRSVK